MNKSEVLKQIKDTGVIPVVRATTADEAMRAIDAIREGGIAVLEITMTVPNAFSVIEQVTTRFGSDALVILVTEKPIPPAALAEELKSTAMLEGEEIRGLEYVMMDENSMWVRYHPGQYQESSSNKLKDYKVENGVVRGTDDNESDLSNGKYSRSAKFVATIAK